MASGLRVPLAGLRVSRFLESPVAGLRVGRENTSKGSLKGLRFRV